MVRALRGNQLVDTVEYDRTLINVRRASDTLHKLIE